LELAQAFSKSASDPKIQNIPSSQRGMPGRNDQPFSRLTDTREHYPSPTTTPVTRHRINGYWKTNSTPNTRHRINCYWKTN
jgi:hypothetical protein